MSGENKARKNAFNSEFQIREITKKDYVKILIIHVILGNILLLLNIALGIMLFTKNEGRMLHKILFLCLPWFPALLLIAGSVNKIISGTIIRKILCYTVFIVMFPILPTYFYINILCGKNKSNLMKELKHLDVQRVIVYTGIYMIFTIFLVLRGTLSLEFEACFEDELGRSACSGYLVIISFASALILYLVAVKELNIDSFPHVSHVISIIFRMTSLAIIICYLDYWAVIPISAILLFLSVSSFYNEKITLKEKIYDETDAPGKIWNGSEWIFLNQKDDIKLTQSEKRDMKNNKEIKSVINLLLQLILPDIKYKANIMIVNFSLICVLIILAYLVNIDLSFNYEPSILDNQAFNTLQTIIIIYGVTSTILLINKVIINCTNGNSKPPLIIIVIALIPAAMLILYTRIVPNLHIFTVIKNKDFVNIEEFTGNILNDQNTFKFDLVDFDVNDIQWNNQDFKNKKNKLVFCRDQMNCDDDNAKLVIIMQNNYRNLRSSSRQPQILSNNNVILIKSDFNVNVLQAASKNTQQLFISTKPPDIAMYSKILKCNSFKNIQVIDNTFIQFKCNQTYIYTNGTIFQRFCLKSKSGFTNFLLTCNKIKDDFSFVKNKTKFTLNDLSFKNDIRNNYCCLNSSHFVSFYGDCSYDFKSTNTSNSYYMRHEQCFRFNLQYSSFQSINNCIIQIGYLSMCLQASRIDQDCDLIHFPCSGIIN